jgi:hypothetical protein
VPKPTDRGLDWDEWNVGSIESFIEAMVHERFVAELAVYHRLRSLQGVDIPKLYGEVTVSYEDPKLVVHGLLLEFVLSLSLREVPELVPKGDRRRGGCIGEPR